MEYETLRWARMNYPNQFMVGVERAAKRCEWRTKWKSGAPHASPEEYFAATSPPLVYAQRIARANNCLTADYEPLGVLEQDAYGALPEEVLDAANQEITRLGRRDSPAATWSALSLAVRTSSDSQLIALVKHLFCSSVVPVHPNASLWLVRTRPTVEHRRALIRALFSATHVPELLERDDFEGFATARGMRTELNFGGLLDMFMACNAPWASGLAIERIGGAVVILFGGLQGGGDAIQGMESLYRPSFMSRPSMHTAAAPDVSADAIEAAFGWWVQGIEGTMRVLLDPVRFCDKSGEYQPEQHFGALISFDRLIACIQALLVYDRRDEFVRRMLMFDALDLLFEGHNLAGEWEDLVNTRLLGRHLKELSRALPAPVNDVFIPRADRAVRGLNDVAKGFFVRERIRENQIRLPARGPQQVDDWKPVEKAVAQYVHLIRNGGAHGLRKTFGSRRDELGLFAAHDGSLPNEVSDTPWLHLLRILADPQTSLERIGTRARSRGA